MIIKLERTRIEYLPPVYVHYFLGEGRGGVSGNSLPEVQMFNWFNAPYLNYMIAFTKLCINQICVAILAGTNWYKTITPANSVRSVSFYHTN